MASSYRCILGLLALVSFIAFSAAAVLFYLGKFYDKSPMKEFYNSSFPLHGYEKYRLDITPAKWTWWMWAPVFAWQIPWLLYAFIIPCRKQPPKVFTMPFYIIASIAFGFTAGWILLWSKLFINVAFGFLGGASMCLYICLALTYHRVRDIYETTKRFPTGDHVMIQLFLINGLALFASWATYSTFLHLGIVLHYTSGVEEHITSTMILAGISCVIFFWFMLDNFVFHNFTVYTFTVYPALVVGFTGSFERYWNYDNPKENGRNDIFNVVLLGVTALLALLKILFMICRTCLRRKRSRSHVVTEEQYDMNIY
ncbi:hypothetical protein QZH41_002155 [Actinostola sp. cb2023]|nr:hypothetical protein QZH41_002841 [Actinostola sp. cb2023]KAK3751751.1 hypothetical protein QZH41_002155 [Actinostola sp. cb2023]